MRFKDLIADMSEELGAEIDIESDACAAAWKKTVADFRASVQRPSASAGGGETFRKGEAIFV